MIYPTARAVALAALGAPVALAVSLVAPGLWTVAGAWVALLIGLLLIDALLGPARSGLSLTLESPAVLGAGATGAAAIRAVFDGPGPGDAEMVVETDARLAVEPAASSLGFQGSEARADLVLSPIRRGEGEITAVWLRWRGRLGLVWKQHREETARKVVILPDVQGVKTRALRLFARDAVFGQKTQKETGQGSEFHALREVSGAVDPRTIDSKQSARHGSLLAKEYRVERNHPVVFAIDTGRAMSEPLVGGPRIDQAINAALLMAYVCLKVGDLAGAYAFADRPGPFSGFVTGTPGFGRLQRHMAGFDYGDAETNYTLGLSQLGAALKRRTLIVVFTEFTDPTSAELMIESLARLMRRHLVLFVAPRDAALEAIIDAEPVDAAAIARAVTAHALIRSRELVIARLTRLGARIIDAPPGRIGVALIDAYVDLKRAGAA